ncbi:MAG: hypothetical protein ABEJ36_04120 [Candidatus Nanosalina sp.]
MESKKLFLLAFLFVAVAGIASAYHMGGYGGYGDYGETYPDLSDPREALTDFVAPFLLIAVLFQRGFEKALSFSYADDKNTVLGPTNKKRERKRIKKFSLIMALATAGMIVPTPWFQLIRLWVANLFSLIGVIFFGAIFAAFVWLLWKVFS